MLGRTRATGPGRAAAVGGSVVHQGTVGAVAPLTAPFLLRVATDPSAHHRAETLGLATAAARREHWGHGTRTTFLQVATQELLCDCGGYAMNWSVEASRNALTTDRPAPRAP
ncbi:hypothetical protein [Streptomyces sp. NWU49]|uniref:hypothetical protein n=1 Tax=Streptomyces sp. NWU49 TaxID=2201153 RepID=UPI00215B4DE5|nr:hypothetical protein [Streptomyces sp. NWU49]